MADELTPYVDRLSAEFGSTRAVYADAVPDGPLPSRYVIVSTSVGETSTTNAAGIADERTPALSIKSVSTDPDAERAAREAKWAARKAVDALVTFRAQVGRATSLPEHIASHGPRRDEDMPDVTVFAVEQFRLRYQL